MNHSLRGVFVLALMLGMPGAASAQTHGGGQASSGGGHASSGGGSHPSGGGGRVSAPSMPVARPVQSQHGFTFPNEPNVRPVTPQHPVNRPVSPRTGANHGTAGYTRAPFNSNVTGGPYH